MAQVIGLIGLGIMGRPMARNLLKAGYALVVHSRSRGPVEEIVKAGATAAASSKDVAAQCDVLITMLPNSPEVEQVVLGPGGVIEGARRGMILVDMSTISPIVSQKVGKALEAKGVAMLDAPVSGGSEGAKKGTLSIFVGGDAADLERAWPVLESLGTTITHLGPIGAGQAVKAVNQVILAGTYLGVAEGVVLALKSGLDVEQVVAALSGGAAQSWVLANRSGRMLENDYPLGFKVALHRKDLGIALSMARELGASLPVSALCEALEAGLIGQGHADDDMSAVARSIRALSGLEA
jgi:3-hydroxyisobutyrate dehydrogenase